MHRLPDFIIIGAMKAATSTLHEQLARQPGIFMSTPKELYFFSDDPVYARGIDWYAAHFAAAAPGDLCGESTTHYAKRPTYPQTIARMQQHVPDARLIYIMRHPIERLVSQYIHQWTEREITQPIDAALDAHPELIDYSRYAWQLAPFLAACGHARVLPLFFDRLHTHPQAELERVARFIGYRGTPHWDDSDEQRNVSAERLRVSPLRDALVYAPLISQIRQYLIPQGVRDRIKALWQMRRRPTLAPASIARLTALFDADLQTLGDWLGTPLTCANFKQTTRDRALDWVAQAQPGHD